MPEKGKTTRRRPVQRMNSARRQLEIVNAAFDRIATTGHLSLSTTELAYKVGISQPAIFRHFRSKQQLHQAILDEANQRVIDELKLLIGHSELWNDPLGLLRDLITKMGASFERDPGVWLTLICQRSLAAEAELPRQPKASTLRGKCAITQLEFALERLCSAAIENRQLSGQAEPAFLSHTMLSLVFGMGQLWLNEEGEFDLSQHLEKSVKGILAGFRLADGQVGMPMTAIA